MNIEVKVGKDGVRYIRPYLGRNMATGKPMRPYKRFPEAKTDEEALAMAEPWLASVVPAAELGASASLGDMLNARLRELRAANAAPKTVETYESVLRNHIAPAGVYHVGEDIPAGRYVLTAEEDAREKNGGSFVTVYPDDSMELGDSLVYEYFEGDYSVSVEDGQILDVSWASFVAA